jgi:outer membrane protein
MKLRVILCMLVVMLAGTDREALAQQTVDSTSVLTLDQAINFALLNNRSAQNARLDVEKANDKIGVTKTQRLPGFKLTGITSLPLSTFETTFEKGVFGTTSSGPTPTEDTVISSSRSPNALVVAQISQPLSQLHRINLKIKQQETQSGISEAKLTAKQQSLVNEVKRAYYAILQSQGAVDAAASNIKLYKELDRVTGEYVIQQVALKTDLMDVQTKLAKAEFEVLTLRNQLVTQREQLNHLLGRDIRTEFFVADGIETVQIIMRETDLTQAREKALSQRPEIREARLRMESAKLEKRIKKSEYIPDVSLTVSQATTIGYSNFMPRSVSGVGLQVEWEAFDWGRKKRELAERELSINQAANDLKEIESQVAMEVNNRFRKVQEASQLLKVSRLAQMAARATVQMVTYKYRLDAVLLKDVLQAQTILANSDYEYQKALLSFWTAKADFEKAIGEDK